MYGDSMKKLLIIIGFIVISECICSQVQFNPVVNLEIVTSNRFLGHIYQYDNRVLKDKELKDILKSKEDKSINDHLEKSNTIETCNMPIAFIFAASLGYNMVNVPIKLIAKEQIGYSIPLVCLGSAIVFGFMNRWQDSEKIKAVEIFNRNVD
jgi:hypothetical protein